MTDPRDTQKQPFHNEISDFIDLCFNTSGGYIPLAEKQRGKMKKMLNLPVVNACEKIQTISFSPEKDYYFSKAIVRDEKDTWKESNVISYGMITVDIDNHQSALDEQQLMRAKEVLAWRLRGISQQLAKNITCILRRLSSNCSISAHRN